MKNALYKPNAASLNLAARKHVDKLTFDTRSEYLAWVAQWKEDYRYIVTARRIEKLRRFTAEPKIAAASVRIKQLEATIDKNKLIEIEARLGNQLSAQYNIWRPLFKSPYILAICMLVIRKAGKLRAAIKRQERTATEQVAI